MTPQSRQALEAMLATARQAAAQRQLAISGAPDAALRAVLGISDAAICRRVAATPRVARRIADRLSAVAASYRGGDLGALLVEDLPTDPDSVRLADVEADGGREMDMAAVADHAPERPLAEVERLVRMIAAAIRMTSAGAILGRDELDTALSLYGLEAVEFGLRHRGAVPEWMREAAGNRSDIQRQLAASAVLCLAQNIDSGASEAAISEAQAYDPLPIAAGAAREGAERIASLAAEFAATYVPDAADGHPT